MSELEKIISDYQASITYQPINGEVNIHSLNFPINIGPRNIALPNSNDTDPFEWAKKSIEELKNLKTFILIPGSKFDISGTRVGRGGGWYDRFLSKIPREWLRIGVADQSQISEKLLKREKWDEQMDWILVNEESSWKAYKCG